MLVNTSFQSQKRFNFQKKLMTFLLFQLSSEFDDKISDTRKPEAIKSNVFFDKYF